ncbi:hypothetical protein [Neobacillus sp. LXY-4]|uniref:hypothetical protein n=1 Tax=Neobacillus sp. LXY-4 TaxID=3379826 RepID=UPI003EDFCAC2
MYHQFGMYPVHNPDQQLSADQDFRDVKSACQRYMNYYVVGQMADGSQVEGIVEDMDDQNVTMLVPEMVEDGDDSRQFGLDPYGGFDGGYGGYGGYGGGYGRRRFRRFRRRRFPYNIFVYPFIFPYPYYY